MHDLSSCIQKNRRAVPHSPFNQPALIVVSEKTYWTTAACSTVNVACPSTPTPFGANEKLISGNELPVPAQNFIAQNLGNVKFLHSLKETERTISTYKIQLENGIKVEFSENGEWKEVKSELNNPIPTEFIPKSIVEYIGKNYPKVGIEKIEKDQKEIKVELLQHNSPTLKFDLDGKFITKS